MLYSKNINISNSNDSLSIIYSFIEPESKVLDIGCACGGLAKALFENKKCELVGMEYNLESVICCQKQNIFTQVHQQDLNLLEVKNYPEYKQQFDYVVCGDVLEHLLYPEKILPILCSYMKKNGEIIISLPNVAHGSVKANLLLNDFSYTDLGILDKTHLHFYTYKTIAKLLADSSLEIMEAKIVTMPLDGYQPHKLSALPQEIVSFIEKDKHSHIMQFVMRCRLNSKTLVKNNLQALMNLALDKNKKTNIMFKIKRLIVIKLPFLLKFIEALRLRR